MYRPFEFLYLFAEHFLPLHHRKARSELKALIRAYKKTDNPIHKLLDVGALKSNYTVGLKADIVLADIPREREVQQELHLGVTEDILTQIMKRRSNISDYIIQDINKNDFPDESFDLITAIEVIEHIHDDEKFVHEVYRILKRGGLFYLTSPNGIAVPNINPDHVRHYTKKELENLLNSIFDEVEIRYEVKIGLFRKWGQNPWKIKKPISTFKSMLGNWINKFQKVKFPFEAANLFAKCFKKI